MSKNYKYQGTSLDLILATEKPAVTSTALQGMTNITNAGYDISGIIVPSTYSYISCGSIGYKYQGNDLNALPIFEEANVGGDRIIQTVGYNTISGALIGGGGGGSGSGGGAKGKEGGAGTSGGNGGVVHFTKSVTGNNRIYLRVGNGGGGGGGGDSNKNQGGGGGIGGDGHATFISFNSGYTDSILSAPGGGKAKQGGGGSSNQAPSYSGNNATEVGDSPTTNYNDGLSSTNTINYSGKGGGGAGHPRTAAGGPNGRNGEPGQAGQAGYALIFLQRT